MEQARALVDAGIRAAGERGYLISVAIVDDAGRLMWLGRMDGAKWLSPDIARGKANVSAAFRQSTTAFEERAGPKTLFYTGVTLIDAGHLAIGQGGLPVWIGDDLVGGIGVSGAAPHEDEEVAAAALEAEGFRPPAPDVAARAALGHSR
jgi:uncharacterized protein GlcG (DUF336 family)